MALLGHQQGKGRVGPHRNGPGTPSPEFGGYKWMRSVELPGINIQDSLSHLPSRRCESWLLPAKERGFWGVFVRGAHREQREHGKTGTGREF